jgi:hypothetical protein
MATKSYQCVRAELDLAMKAVFNNLSAKFAADPELSVVYMGEAGKNTWTREQAESAVTPQVKQWMDNRYWSARKAWNLIDSKPSDDGTPVTPAADGTTPQPIKPAITRSNNTKIANLRVVIGADLDEAVFSLEALPGYVSYHSGTDTFNASRTGSFAGVINALLSDPIALVKRATEIDSVFHRPVTSCYTAHGFTSTLEAESAAIDDIYIRACAEYTANKKSVNAKAAVMEYMTDSIVVVKSGVALKAAWIANWEALHIAKPSGEQPSGEQPADEQPADEQLSEAVDTL